MESFEIALTDSGFHIDGFPDATKVESCPDPRHSNSPNLLLTRMISKSRSRP